MSKNMAPIAFELPAEESLRDHAARLNPEVRQQLSRLAVLHEAPEELMDKQQSHPELHSYSDPSGDVYLDAGIRAAQHLAPKRRLPLPWTRKPEEMPKWAAERLESHEKQQALRAVHEVIFKYMQPDRYGKAGAVDWLGAAEAILEEAKETPRDSLFAAAVLTAQFAPTLAEREKFVNDIYESNHQENVAAACERSHLVTLVEDQQWPGSRRTQQRHVYPLEAYAPAFRLSSQEYSRYMEHVRARKAEVQNGVQANQSAEPAPSARTYGKVVVENAKKGVPNTTIAEDIERASVQGEKVWGAALDIGKVERFGLQEFFIHEQAKEILGDEGESSRTPLADALAERRADPVPSGLVRAYELLDRAPTAQDELEVKLAKLQLDAESSLLHLSQPIRNRFSLEGVDISDPAKLTPEQAAEWRFQYLARRTESHAAIAKYLLPQVFTTRSREIILANRFNHIWSTSVIGGDAPRSTLDLITVIIDAARRSSITASAEELRDVAHRSRSLNLRLAGFNIADFRESNSPLSTTAPTLERSNGTLQLMGIKEIPRDQQDMYAAVALGCPALRIRLPGTVSLPKGDQVKEGETMKLAKGNANYIDHIAATMIEEAYQRGLFGATTAAAR